MRALRRASRHECVIDQCVAVPVPAAVVWDFLADIQDAEPIPGFATVQMSKDPLGPTTTGTRWHERIRFAPGVWLRIESTVTQASRPRVLAMIFRSRWWSGALRYEITTTGEGCSLRHLETLVPCLPMRPMTRWIEHRLGLKIRQRLRDIHDVLLSRSHEETGMHRCE